MWFDFRNILTTAFVLTVIFLTPIVIYGVFQATIGAEIPGGITLLIFLSGVLVEKAGVAIAFCSIFYFAYDTFCRRWVLYASIWWGMFAFGELGQVIVSNYSWKEALAGILSEALYFPASAWLAQKFIRT